MNHAEMFIEHHWFILFLGFQLFSSFVSTMPTPNDGGAPPLNGWKYKWAFNFLHTITGNLGRIAATNPAVAKLFPVSVAPDPATGVSPIEVKQAQVAAIKAEVSAGKAADLLTPKPEDK